eukprot:135236-Prymnesium_polylepis.1
MDPDHHGERLRPRRRGPVHVEEKAVFVSNRAAPHPSGQRKRTEHREERRDAAEQRTRRGAAPPGLLDSAVLGVVGEHGHQRIKYRQVLSKTTRKPARAGVVGGQHRLADCAEAHGAGTKAQRTGEHDQRVRGQREVCGLERQVHAGLRLLRA